MPIGVRFEATPVGKDNAMTHTSSSQGKQPPERVARFEAARAALRPAACDEREGCWVKCGAAGYHKGTKTTGTCTACGAAIYSAGNEAAPAAALSRCMRAQ